MENKAAEGTDRDSSAQHDAGGESSGAEKEGGGPGSGRRRIQNIQVGEARLPRSSVRPLTFTLKNLELSQEIATALSILWFLTST